MLEYSGTLLHGLRAMGLDDVFDALRYDHGGSGARGRGRVAGRPWGHAVAPSTPVQDYRLHVRAWQHHFAAMFGSEALGRVRGFSPGRDGAAQPPGRGLRVRQDARRLRLPVGARAGAHGRAPGRPARAPSARTYRTAWCAATRPETRAEIIAIIKTQGSDTKLVGQMQPYYEAKGLSPWELAGRQVPPLVTQIADGENGGVMMNEFPPKYLEVVREACGTATPMVNVTEYLEHLFAAGIREDDLPAIQPVHQQRIWDRYRPGDGPERLAEVIADLEREDGRFHVEGGSWTNDLSWVRGYEPCWPHGAGQRAVLPEGARPGVSSDEPGTAMRSSTCSRRRRAATATGARGCGPTTAANCAAGPRRSCSTTSDDRAEAS